MIYKAYQITKFDSFPDGIVGNKVMYIIRMPIYQDREQPTMNNFLKS